jgi:hypothetical protein
VGIGIRLAFVRREAGEVKALGESGGGTMAPSSAEVAWLAENQNPHHGVAAMKRALHLTMTNSRR